MLVLNPEDMKKAISFEEIMSSIEEAFELYTRNQYKMTDRFVLSYGGNTMLYMPCYAAGFFGTKILAEWPQNPKKNLPYLDGLVLLNREEDGRIEAILNGNTLTSLRTGAVGGVAIRHLSDPGVKNVGLIGCGAQGLHLLAYAAVARNVQTIYLFDSFKKELQPFIDSLQQMIAPKNVRCVVCSDAESALGNSEVIYTATQATTPVLPNDAKKLEGKVFISIGSWKPTMREIPEAIWEVVNEVYTELPYACEESGDLSQPLKSGALTMDRVRYMGDYLNGKKCGTEPVLGNTRFYKSVGMGIFDTLSAKQIFEAAKRKGLGQFVEW